LAVIAALHSSRAPYLSVFLVGWALPSANHDSSFYSFHISVVWGGKLWRCVRRWSRAASIARWSAVTASWWWSVARIPSISSGRD